MGGVILAALGIPEVMGYTKIIGTPVVTGLYTMMLPMIAFAIFGCSRHLVVSTDSATAAMVAAALTSLSFTAYTPQYAAMTSLVALVAGVMLTAARMLRAGWARHKDLVGLPGEARRRVSALAASVRPHNPGDSNRRDGKPMATIRGKKIGRYKNRIFTGRLT